MIQAVSFDVFDTLLTRIVAPPDATFLLLGRRAELAETTPEAFARARIKAEALALRNAGPLYTLAQIYAQLQSALRLTSAERDRLMGLETELEVELLRPVPGARERVQTARTQGQRVVFVSDTYLPASFVQERLDQHGLWQEADSCYVSCAAGYTKRAGALFREVLRRETIAPNSVRHVGNDRNADVRSAKRAGMRTEHVVEANPNRYEQLLAAHYWSTQGLSAAMAGASRLARLSIDAVDARQAALRDVAAGVVAPTLVGYVLWVLQQVQQRALDRLYFVARDGQILLDIAHRLAEKLHVSCDLRYLYGSRSAWNLPALGAMGKEEMTRSLNRPSWIWDSTSELSVRTVLGRVCIHPDEVRGRLDAIGLDDVKWDRAMKPDELTALRSLFQDESVQDLLHRKAAMKQDLLLRYLAQQGLLDQCNSGIVDLTGHGTLHDSLTAVLRAVGLDAPVGFYFGLLNGADDHSQVERAAYFYDERTGLGLTGIYTDWGVIPLEVFCAADHGTLIDYGVKDGRIQPVLKESRNHAVVAWGLPVVRETANAFVDHLLLDDAMLHSWADVRDATADVLRTFWWHPTRAEAEAWSAFPWEDGQGREAKWRPLAQRYRWRHVIQSVVKGKVIRHHRASWFAGSAALSPPTVRLAMRGLKRAEGVARAWRRGWRPAAATFPLRLVGPVIVRDDSSIPSKGAA